MSSAADRPRAGFRLARIFSALALAVILLAAGAADLRAHALHFTRLILTFSGGEAELRIETDLAPLLDSPEAAAELARAPAEIQTPRLTDLAAEILREISPAITPGTEPWRFTSWRIPAVAPEPGAAADTASDAAFTWRSRLAGSTAGATLQIASRADARIEFPVVCSLQLPGDARVLTHWLRSPGDFTAPIALSSAPAADTAASASVSVSATATAPETGAPGFVATVGEFLQLGFLHILPLGLDHILFVLGLYFLGAGWRALAAQIATFTVAHTTTLGLAAAGIVRAPASIVEPLIALSIVFVALENIFRPRVGPGRLVAVFVFGLLHGLGFAGALSELDLPRDRFFAALLSFNFGVDFGQLAVLAIAFLTVGWFRQKAWYRDTLAVPACALIAAIGVYWTVERALF